MERFTLPGPRRFLVVFSERFFGRRPSTGFALPVLCLVEAMVLVDTTVLNIALPSIGRDLGLSLSGLQWVITGYALPLGGLLLVGGRAGDLWGRRRVFTVGLTVFTGASLAGGLAPTAAVLLAARVAQGVGAAALAPTALALVADLFPPGARRDRALGWFSAVAALGFTLGAVAGGVLTELAGWRWVLLVNVPAGLAGLFLAPALKPATAPGPGGTC